MHFRSLFFLPLFFLAPQISASDFPTGNLRGTGFVVEKGNQKITQKDLYAYSSSAEVVKQSDGRYQITIVASVQRTPTSPKKDDKRVDVYQVVWESPTSGKLLNSNGAYKYDKSNFVISNGQLVIKSWITRNKVLETQIYSLKSERHSPPKG